MSKSVLEGPINIPNILIKSWRISGWSFEPVGTDWIRRIEALGNLGRPPLHPDWQKEGADLCCRLIKAPGSSRHHSQNIIYGFLYTKKPKCKVSNGVCLFFQFFFLFLFWMSEEKKVWKWGCGYKSLKFHHGDPKPNVMSFCAHSLAASLWYNEPQSHATILMRIQMIGQIMFPLYKNLGVWACRNIMWSQSAYSVFMSFTQG